MKPELVAANIGIAKRHLLKWYWRVQLVIAHPYGTTAHLQRAVVATGHSLSKRRAQDAAEYASQRKITELHQQGRLLVYSADQDA